MFEISVAFKYLLPRKKQLSVSLISLMSVLVISLVVWLVLVFLSVTEGIEKKWLDKLTSLNAPLRITPTPAYYSSYYYQIDAMAAASHFEHKSISEKLKSPSADPYSYEEDGELPFNFPLPDRNPDGSLKDPVCQAYQILDGFKKSNQGLVYQDFEMGGALLRLQLLRSEAQVATGKVHKSQSFLTQVSYIASYPDQSPYVQKLLLPIRSADVNHLYFLSQHATQHSREDAPSMLAPAPLGAMQQRLQDLSKQACIRSLKTTYPYWKLPRNLLPQKAELKGCIAFENGNISHISIPVESNQPIKSVKDHIKEGVLQIQQGQLNFITKTKDCYPVPPSIPLIVEGDLSLKGALVEESLSFAKRLEEIQFAVSSHLQGIALEGKIHWDGVEIADADCALQANALTPYWAKPNAPLPINEEKEAGILLAKNFQDNGVLVGDRGYLSYSTSTTGSIQEQRLPVFVAGFYDPGVMSIGAKCILVPSTLAHTISSSSSSFNLDRTQSTGISVWFPDLDQAEHLKQKLIQAFSDAGIDSYWKVTTFREYDFAKDLLEQFQSDQYLFTLVGAIILIVACCNIISLLVLLVNDKKREIGILQAMGASRYSIAMIFGTCGVALGIISSLIGTIGALLTLEHIDVIVNLLSMLQGHDAFNATFFGSSLPNELSRQAVLFILIVTPLLSFCAGLVPAMKACRLRPSAILRSE